MEFNSGFKVLIQLSSWRWAHSCSKHLEDSNKHSIEDAVRHVGHLPELEIGVLVIVFVVIDVKKPATEYLQ